MTPNYYRARLAGERLRHCYELSSSRIQQYLDAEVAHVVRRIETAASVLELGCGYGRVLARLTRPSRWTVGIDTSIESLQLARRVLDGKSACEVTAMDARELGFTAGRFDAVICVQNGICAFRVDPRAVFQEALRVARPGGLLLFSTYAERFWGPRVEWFEAQAAAGLVGEIDYAATRPGEIVCQDGFRSGTFSVAQFTSVCADLDLQPTFVEIDESSVFCEVTARGAAGLG